MSIQARCPACKATVRVKEDLAGRRIKCPDCSGPVSVPIMDVAITPTEHEFQPSELDGPWIEPEPPRKSRPTSRPKSKSSQKAKPSRTVNPSRKVKKAPEANLLPPPDPIPETPPIAPFQNDEFFEDDDNHGDDEDLLVGLEDEGPYSAKPIRTTKPKPVVAGDVQPRRVSLDQISWPKISLANLPTPVIFGGLFAGGLLITTIILQIFSGGEGDGNSDSQESSAIQSNSFEDTSEVAAKIGDTLDEMQALLHAGKLREFTVQYAPMAEVERLRRADLSNSEMPTVPRRRILKAIEMVGSASPSIMDGGWKLELRHEETAKQNDTNSIKGYGSDINRALSRAISDLEAGKFQTFIDKMFPESARSQVMKNGALRSVLADLKSGSPLVLAMLADLKELQRIEPYINGNTAAYLLPPFKAVPGFPNPAQSPGSFPPEDREIRFSLIDGSWRFYDNLADVNVGGSGRRLFRLTFERIGDSWRLSSYP